MSDVFGYCSRLFWEVHLQMKALSLQGRGVLLRRTLINYFSLTLVFELYFSQQLGFHYLNKSWGKLATMSFEMSWTNTLALSSLWHFPRKIKSSALLLSKYHTMFCLCGHFLYVLIQLTIRRGRFFMLVIKLDCQVLKTKRWLTYK